MSPGVCHGRQRGIALMLVMWVLTLLTVMAVSLTATQRTETALTENHVAAARFRALADAALAYTALDFMMQSPGTDEETEATWLPNGQERRWLFNGIELSIAVFNETSRINLNLVQAETLADLLSVLGTPEDEANALAAAIVDWRDEDDLALLNGAEDEDYERSGAAIGAKDANYTSVEELRQVLGMSEDIYRRLVPEVTVDGEAATPVERFASPAVLAATRGISLEEAVEEVGTRDLTTVPEATAANALDRGGPLYRVQVTERRTDKTGRRMEALIQLNRGQQPPYLVLWRRYGLSLKDPVYGEADIGEGG
ncbi:general secretion pathway protein GspK [Thiorhodococcus mannitoliphagus]|uniref:General secretion pathway protein GspK n=2 Tax=Thiorhodococcus mannitoliphagus TaxID=329406 RepID=A0A6P1DKJ3_9GAMM|nr:general secretion pathway protein GspK [Thiorhodococcus mannitoliphagus]